jgi:hypothetical protein
MSKILAGDWLAHDGLNEEALGAFCLNLRFLIQPKDGYAIKDIQRIAEGWPQIHHDLQHEVLTAISELNKNLAEPSLVRLSEERPTSNWELFEIVFYGRIAHENPGKREQFDRMANAGPFSYFMFQAFVSVIFHYHNCTSKVADNVHQYLIREGVFTD